MVDIFKIQSIKLYKKGYLIKLVFLTIRIALQMVEFAQLQILSSYLMQQESQNIIQLMTL